MNPAFEETTTSNLAGFIFYGRGLENNKKLS